MCDKIPSGLEHDQSETGKRSSVLFSQCFEAAIRGGDFVSVDDSKPIAGKKFRLGRCDFTENVDHFLGGFADQGLGHRDFDTGNFVVQSIDGKGKSSCHAL